MNHTKQPYWEIPQQRFILAMTALIIICIPIALFTSPVEDNFTAYMLILWGVCLGLYILSDLLAGPLSNRLWAGYLYLSCTVLWLILDLGPALLMLVVGTALTTWLRQRRTVRVLLAAHIPPPLIGLGLARLTILGGGLLVAALVYTLLPNTHLPFMADAAGVMAGIVALFAGLLTTQIIGSWLVKTPIIPQDWHFGHILSAQNRWLNELLLLFVVMPLVLIYQSLGVAVFTLVVGLIAAQAIRHYQILHTQNELTQRVDALSLLNQVGPSISANLALDDVLKSIYTWVCKITNVTLFYVAFYDAEQDAVDFPYVVQGEQSPHWPRRAIPDDPFIQHVIRTRLVLYVERDQDKGVLNGFGSLPGNGCYQVYLGIPLMTGEKLIGLMALVMPDREKILGKLELHILETIANQASLAIRNAMLYSRSVQWAQNLTHINHSVQDVMFNLNDEEALRATCETALKVAGTHKVALFLLNQQDRSQSRLAYSMGLTQRHRALYAGPIHRPDLYYVEPRIVPDVDLLSERDVLTELAEAGEFKALAEIPLKSGNMMVGMMSVFYDAPHYFQETELELLGMLAHQTTAAIDYIELLEALEMYASEQAQLVHLSRISNASLELETVVHSIMNMLRQMLAMDHVRIGLFAEEKAPIDEQAHLLMYYPYQHPPDLLAVAAWPELQALVQQAQPGPRIYYLANKLSDELSAFMRQSDEQMLALVPLVANNALLGMVLMGKKQAHHFSDGEWRLLEMATNQIATQIHNAQLYQHTENALNRRLQQLGLIEDIARQISSSLNLDQLISNVLQSAVQATQADVASLGLLLENGTYRVITRERMAGVWHESELIRQRAEGIAQQVMEDGRMRVIPDNHQAPGYGTLPDYHQLYFSSVTVPLFTEDKIIGVLSVESTLLDFFNDERIEFIKNLAGHAVISIQNAGLLQERQAQIETLIQLRDLSLRLSSNVDPASVRREVLRTAITLLGGRDAAIARYDANTQRVAVVAAMTLEDGAFYDVAMDVPEYVWVDAAINGEIQIIEDVRQVSGYAAENAYTSVLAAPIKRGNQIKEVLTITLPHRGHLNTKANILALLTIQVAGHLQNAELYARIQEDGNQMRAILDSTNEGILLLDKNGKLIRHNASAEALLSLPLDDYLGKNFAETYLLQFREAPTEDQPNSIRAALRDTARILRLEPQRITSRSLEIMRDGKVIYIEEVGSPVWDKDGYITGRLLTFRDISEERKLAAYRDEITHMVVHDLRNPLASIISSLNLNQEILDPYKEEGEFKQVYILNDVSLSSAANLMKLVDTILDIARLETRRMPLEIIATRVEAMVQEAILSLKATAQEARITIRQEIAADIPSVLVDHDKIRRVIINLLANALGYTPIGGEVLISAAMAGRRKVIIRVADSGPGIPTDAAERIFEKFGQIKDKSRPARRGSMGSGLGLTFCKLAVEAHNQSIWVEQNGPLSGACFAFTLPVAPPDATIEKPPPFTEFQRGSSLPEAQF